jgi:hypothetical protein
MHLLIAVLLASHVSAAQPQASPVPYQIHAAEGKLSINGINFSITADWVSVSPDGKQLVLVGQKGDPVVLTHRLKGQSSTHSWTGDRMIFFPTDGNLRIEGAGSVIEIKVREK